MNRTSVILALILLPLMPAWSLDVRESVYGHGNPARQWLLIASTANSQLVPAELVRDQEKFIVSATIPDSQAPVRVAGVIELASGEVISSALHELGSQRTDIQSMTKGAGRIEALQTELETLREKIRRSEIALDVTEAQHRLKNGQADIQDIYAKVAELEREIAALETAKTALQ